MPTAETPRALLAEAGAALYGPLWQSALARDLDVAVRTMQRWAAGDVPVPDRLMGELRMLVADRRAALAPLERRLAAAAREAA